MRLFARQLYFELLKLFARKRTYFGFGAFLAIELFILGGLQARGPRQMLTRAMTMHGMDFSHYYSGLTMAYSMISYTVFVLGSVYLALVCGDIVAKEVEDGTMRMVLSRPVSRGRILVLKYGACVIYTWSLALFIVGSSLLLGIIDRGVGGLIVIAPWEHVFGVFEAGPGFERFGLAAGMLCFSMLTLATMGFMFSCFNVKPASATVLTLSLYLFDNVLHNVPYFESIQGYFLTQHMGMWVHVFEPTVPWSRILHSAGYLAAFDLLFLAVGAVYFARRDFKS